MKRETIRFCPPSSDPIWLHIARHESAHAVAYVLAAMDIFGNPRGLHGVQIRPGKTNIVPGRTRPIFCFGVCESTGLYNGVGTGIAEAYVRTKSPLILDQIKAAEWEIVACVAGPFADVFSQGCKSLHSMRWHSRLARVGTSDFEAAEAVFEDLRILAGRRAGWVKLLERSRRLVLDNWTAIDALATALLQKNRLEQNDVVAIVTDHIPSLAA